MPLDRNAILEAPDLLREEVDTPEWGGTVLVRMLSFGELLALKDVLEANQDVTAELVVACACDASGARIFTREDVAALVGKTQRPLEAVALAAAKLNGLVRGAVERLEKKSEGTPSSPSPCD